MPRAAAPLRTPTHVKKSPPITTSQSLPSLRRAKPPRQLGSLSRQLQRLERSVDNATGLALALQPSPTSPSPQTSPNTPAAAIDRGPLRTPFSWSFGAPLDSELQLARRLSARRNQRPHVTAGDLALPPRTYETKTAVQSSGASVAALARQARENYEKAWRAEQSKRDEVAQSSPPKVVEKSAPTADEVAKRKTLELKNQKAKEGLEEKKASAPSRRLIDAPPAPRTPNLSRWVAQSPSPMFNGGWKPGGLSSPRSNYRHQRASTESLPSGWATDDAHFLPAMAGEEDLSPGSPVRKNSPVRMRNMHIGGAGDLTSHPATPGGLGPGFSFGAALGNDDLLLRPRVYGPPPGGPQISPDSSPDLPQLQHSPPAGPQISPEPMASPESIRPAPGGAPGAAPEAMRPAPSTAPEGSHDESAVVTTSDWAMNIVESGGDFYHAEPTVGRPDSTQKGLEDVGRRSTLVPESSAPPPPPPAAKAASQPSSSHSVRLAKSEPAAEAPVDEKRWSPAGYDPPKRSRLKKAATAVIAGNAISAEAGWDNEGDYTDEEEEDDRDMLVKIWSPSKEGVPDPDVPDEEEPVIRPVAVHAPAPSADL